MNLKSIIMRNPSSWLFLSIEVYASLWSENSKKNRTKEPKFKIKRLSKLKKLINKRFSPFSYRQELYFKITLKAKCISR